MQADFYAGCCIIMQAVSCCLFELAAANSGDSELPDYSELPGNSELPELSEYSD